MLIILRFNWSYNFFLGYFGGNGEKHKEELYICFMVQIFRILLKMFSSKWLFLWMLLFSFFNVFNIWRSSISACSLLPSIQWLPLVRRWCLDSGWRIQQFICTSLCPHSLQCSATGQPWACTYLHLSICSVFLSWF